MSRPDFHFEWRQLAPGVEAPAASPRRRGRAILAAYAVALGLVLLRAAQLELSDGAEFRRLAAQPIEKSLVIAAPRGRIVARDGTVLAADLPAQALAVQFRYLEQPPDRRWLRRLARERLTPAERRDPEKLAATESFVEREIASMHARLAELCHVPPADWQARTRRITTRVNELAQRVNRRRREQFLEQALTTENEEIGAAAILAGLFAPPDPLPPASVILIEQTAYHRIVDDLPAQAVEIIEDHAANFPGVKVISHVRRAYPLATAAAHVVGHVGGDAGARETMITARTSDAGANAVGVLGIERLCEDTLRGQPGRRDVLVDRRGNELEARVQHAARAGHDVVLTLDIALQHFAEQLLDRFARSSEADTAGHGGAIVVLDVTTGEVLAAASQPRFDPNWFASGDPRAAALLADPSHPLFDRVGKMAIAPGSVFKPLVALALVEHRVVDPREPFHCQGYWSEPDRLRCQIYRAQGIGHGELTLADALARSCNVYFFEHAPRLGGAALHDWAARFGFGTTCANWPDAAKGQLPTADELSTTDHVQAFAIGQGAFTATPLQVARMMAAIANGGYLVEPRLLRGDESAPRRRIDDLSSRALDAVREGLDRTVNHPSGTAYQAAHATHLSIAGKTGTAETGGNRPDHAWFAGYAPAAAPRVAFVVALEHGGSGAQAATLARHLVARMLQLGYFAPLETAEQRLPPGKG